MATSYTPNAFLLKPGTSDRNWDIPLNSNMDLLDGMTSIGRLLVTPTEIPSAQLAVRITGGSYLKRDGTLSSYAGATSVTLPASSTSALWLNESGLLTVSSAFPTTPHVRLAMVATSASSVTSIADQRVSCQTIGASSLALAGTLTVAASASAPVVLSVDAGANTIGFFGASPSTQAPSMAPLADQTNGSVGSAVSDVGAAFSQSVLNNNLATLASSINRLIAVMKRHGLMSS